MHLRGRGGRYFFSGNCRKELEATLANNSPMILLHETDLGRGGASLEQLRDDCAAEHRARVFAPDRPVIPWQRIKEFQLASLKMVVGSMLRQQKVLRRLSEPSEALVAPAESRRNSQLPVLEAEESQSEASATPRPRLSQMPGGEAKKRRWKKRSAGGAVGGEGALGSDLYVPGELTREPLGFLRSVKLYASPNNPGGPELAGDMAALYPKIRLAESSAWKSSSKGQRPSGSGSVWGASTEGGARYFLLVLNKWTFLGEEGSKLAAEVTEARAIKLHIVLAHETDGARGGCEFSEFFKTTPQDLVSGGLYSKIAVAFQPGAHRDVSYCLLAKDLGARRQAFGQVTAMRIEQGSLEARKRVSSVGGQLSRRSSSISQLSRRSSSRTPSVLSVTRSKTSCGSIGEDKAPAAVEIAAPPPSAASSAAPSAVASASSPAVMEVPVAEEPAAAEELEAAEEPASSDSWFKVGPALSEGSAPFASRPLLASLEAPAAPQLRKAAPRQLGRPRSLTGSRLRRGLTIGPRHFLNQQVERS